jgi:hypothetical protein
MSYIVFVSCRKADTSNNHRLKYFYDNPWKSYEIPMKIRQIVFHQKNEKRIALFFSLTLQHIRLVGFMRSIVYTVYRNNTNFPKRGFTGFQAWATQLLSATVICALQFPIKRISRVIMKSINESMRAFVKSQPALLRRSRISRTRIARVLRGSNGRISMTHSSYNGHLPVT